MSLNPTVNRCLDDKAFDHIDHALGRPVLPLRESYRNYFATDNCGRLAGAFQASSHWEFSGKSGDMAYFHVTDAGRKALAAHLASLKNAHRAFAVTFEGRTSIVPARSAAKARYSLYLDISDTWSDLTFGDFARATSVRIAA